MKTPLRRLFSSGIAVLLGVLFISTTLFLGDSFQATLEEAVAGTARDAAVVVRQTSYSSGKEPDPVTTQMRDQIKALPETESVRTVRSFGVLLDREDGKYVDAMNLQPLTNRTTLAEGRLPERSGEVAITPEMVKDYDVKLGSQHKLLKFNGEGMDVTVVGIINAGNDTLPFPMSYIFVTEADTEKLTMREPNELDTIFVNGSGDADKLRDKIAQLDKVKGTNVEVETRAQFRESMKKELAGDSGMRILTTFFLAFGVVALAVAALVITNTFTILVAQRTRQFALLRCVGATKRQVFGMVVKEAALTALIAGALGVVGGMALTAAAVPVLARLLKIGVGRLAFNWQGFVFPILAALLVTILAALPAARQATRVAPMAALRPQTAGVLKRKAGVVQLVFGFIFLAAGVAALIFAATTKGMVLAGIAGGIVSFVGLLMLGGLFVPGLIGAIGLPLRKTGVPAELAVDNALRNPSRTAATASALLIGVTLVSMMTVGAASAQKTMATEIDQYFPADLVAHSRTGSSVTDAQIERIRQQDGVASVTPMYATSVTSAEGGRPFPFQIWALEDAKAGLRDQRVAAALNDSTIVYGSDWKYQGKDVVDGMQVKLMRMEFEGDDGVAKQLPSVTLTAKVLDKYQAGPVVSVKTIKAIDANAERQAVVNFDKNRDAIDVYRDLNKNLADLGLAFSGPAVERQMIQQIVDGALFMVLALLAVAVIISIVGVGNTLSLAVLERTQELGLLRALGLTRSQTRRMIAVEALLMGGVATVLGMLVGCGYGIAGISSLLAGEDFTAVFAIPWARMAVIFAVAMLAAWLASVVPANRAARISPQEALSTE